MAFETTYLTYNVVLIIVRHKNEKIANRKKIKACIHFYHIEIDAINFTSNSKIAATLSSNGYVIDLGNKKDR